MQKVDVSMVKLVRFAASGGVRWRQEKVTRMMKFRCVFEELCRRCRLQWPLVMYAATPQAAERKARKALGKINCSLCRCNVVGDDQTLNAPEVQEMGSDDDDSLA